MATLGVVPAAIFPGAVPKAFAAEKVIRLRKAGRLAIMALLNNVSRHSCQIETPLSGIGVGSIYKLYRRTQRAVV